LLETRNGHESRDSQPQDGRKSAGRS